MKIKYILLNCTYKIVFHKTNIKNKLDFAVDKINIFHATKTYNGRGLTRTVGVFESQRGPSYIVPYCKFFSVYL